MTSDAQKSISPFFISGQVVRCLVLFFILAAGGCAPEAEETYDVVLLGGRVMDPASGMDGVRNVGIRGGSIAMISDDELAGERVIDVAGLVVAPGFIDLHEHGQTDEAYRFMVRDGVTTALELEVGTGNIAEWYTARDGGQVVNYGVSIGHIPVRMIVMEDRGEWLPSGLATTEPASPEQIDEMARLIGEGLAQGAVAVGFGIAYTPAATVEEFETMLRVGLDHGSGAHIHTRGGMEGLAEAIAGARNTGASVHVVHSNSSGGSNSHEFLEMIQAARSEGLDVTTEAYPYEASATRIESALFDDWETWDDEQFEIHQWVATGERLNRESFGRYRAEGGSIISHSRTEEMTLAAISHPLTMIASDGKLENGRGHPRSTGSYAKVLGRYVRELGVLDLMDALRRMTIAPAERLQQRAHSMTQKGRIRMGSDADLTIFNPDTVIDRSTYTEPDVPSEGIEYVLVNGVVVVDEGELVEGVRPGKPIRSLR